MGQTTAIQRDVVGILGHVGVALKRESFRRAGAAIGELVLNTEAAESGMADPESVIQIGGRLFAFGSKCQREGIPDFIRAWLINEFEGLAGAVFEILEGPAFDDGAAIGKDNMIERGIDDLLLLRPGGNHAGSGFGSGVSSIGGLGHMHRRAPGCGGTGWLEVFGARGNDGLRRDNTELAISPGSNDENQAHQHEGDHHPHFVRHFFLRRGRGTHSDRDGTGSDPPA